MGHYDDGFSRWCVSGARGFWSYVWVGSLTNHCPALQHWSVSSESWWVLWRWFWRTRRAGLGRRWPRSLGCPGQRSVGSGERSDWSRIWRKGFKLSNDPPLTKKVYDIARRHPHTHHQTRT